MQRTNLTLWLWFILLTIDDRHWQSMSSLAGLEPLRCLKKMKCRSSFAFPKMITILFKWSVKCSNGLHLWVWNFNPWKSLCYLLTRSAYLLCPKYNISLCITVVHSLLPGSFINTQNVSNTKGNEASYIIIFGFGISI